MVDIANRVIVVVIVVELVKLKEGEGKEEERDDELFIFSFILFGLRSSSRWRHRSARVQTAIGKFLLIRRLWIQNLLVSSLFFLVDFQWNYLEDLEGAHQSLVNRHHGAGIVEFAAVIRRRKECHQLPFGEKLVAILHDLFPTSTNNQNGVKLPFNSFKFHNSIKND